MFIVIQIPTFLWGNFTFNRLYRDKNPVKIPKEKVHKLGQKVYFHRGYMWQPLVAHKALFPSTGISSSSDRRTYPR